MVSEIFLEIRDRNEGNISIFEIFTGSKEVFRAYCFRISGRFDGII